MRLVFDCDKSVGEWVAKRIPHMLGEFENFRAIGVRDGNQPVAGVVYSDWIEDYGTVQISMAADTPRWAQRGIIKALLHYPFEQVGANKIWTATPETNERAMRFNFGIGLKKEAVLRHHFGKKRHAVIASMLRKEYGKRYA